MDTRTEQFAELRKHQRHFRKALEQVSVMDERLKDLNKRYTLAFHSEMYTLCENIDLRISIAEDVLELYTEFTLFKSKQIEKVFTKLFYSLNK